MTSPAGSPNSSRGLEIEMCAPMAVRMSSTPVRVGLSPTSDKVTREPGTIAAAASRNAADEMSPGSVPSRGLSDVAGWTVSVSPAETTVAPMARSMRAVWSREGSGSCRVTGASAPSAASSRQLFTCAEATGST